MKSKAEYIYGDTDSVFIKYDMNIYEQDENGENTDKVIGRIPPDKILAQSIKYGLETEEFLDQYSRTDETPWGLKNTGQVLEYEKTFFPLVLARKIKFRDNLLQRLRQ